MIQESENMKKLRNRNLFEEIKQQVTQIQTTRKREEDIERERKQEYDKIIKEIFGD